MSESIPLKDDQWESRLFLGRVKVCCSVLLMLTLLLAARFFYLQVVQHDVYATLSDRNRIQVQPLPPARGLIYDRNGELLAGNAPSFSLTITPERVDSLADTISSLAGILDLSRDEIDTFRKRLQRRQRPFESVPLRFKLTQAEMARVSVDGHKLPGVGIEARLVRHYPKAELMAHAVGTVGRIDENDARRLDPVAYAGMDHVGKSGVERFYEQELLGEAGHRKVETDARGRIMKTLESTLPKPGRSLVLHIDSALQQAASDALGDRRGTVVALEPETGGIMAMVSKPGYDPNLFVTGMDHATYISLRDSPDTPLFNRALQGQYQPGSTIKPIMALAGLVTGVTDANHTIHDPGWFQLPDSNRLYRDWNWQTSDAGGHGEVNLEKAIYRSCNVYFYQLAVKMGIDRMSEYLALFGLGANTVLDLPEAGRGLLPTREWKEEVRGKPWVSGDSVNVGIGQGDILVTPLQLATAIAVMANRGKWVAPRALQSGSELLAQRSSAPGPVDIDRVPEHVWDTVIGAMEQVIHRGGRAYGENGTAWHYIGRDLPYRMAGKSGTAQVVGIRQDNDEYDEDELTERQREHAWFVAFAPVEKPRIALAVLVENGGGGSEFAAPVARRIIDYHLLRGAPMVVAGAGP